MRRKNVVPFKNPVKRFCYLMGDHNGIDINPFPLDVEARDLGHALQKIAAALPDECHSVRVYTSMKFG